MPLLELTSSSAESFFSDLRLTSTPSAMLGAVAGLTWAVQEVRVVAVDREARVAEEAGGKVVGVVGGGGVGVEQQGGGLIGVAGAFAGALRCRSRSSPASRRWARWGWSRSRSGGRRGRRGGWSGPSGVSRALSGAASWSTPEAAWGTGVGVVGGGGVAGAWATMWVTVLLGRGVLVERRHGRRGGTQPERGDHGDDQARRAPGRALERSRGGGAALHAPFLPRLHRGTAVRARMGRRAPRRARHGTGGRGRRDRPSRPVGLRLVLRSRRLLVNERRHRRRILPVRPLRKPLAR